MCCYNTYVYSGRGSCVDAYQGLSNEAALVGLYDAVTRDVILHVMLHVTCVILALTCTQAGAAAV
jgi:hypothetical protein